MPAGNGLKTWEQYQIYVVEALERLENGLKERDAKMEEFALKLKEYEITLKLKSGVWGLVGGAIPVAVMIAVYLITRH